MSEVLNKQDEKWMPSTGEWCEVIWRCDDSFEQICPIFISDYTIVFEDKGGKERHADLKYVSIFRPIQAPADKYREDQIAKIYELIASFIGAGADNPSVKTDAIYLYSKGCRVLAPNQFAANELTGRQVALISGRAIDEQWSFQQVINAVIAEMKKAQL